MVDTKLHMICIWILLCAFCACPQGVCSRWWMEMFLNFATMCFFICLLKELGPEHAKSHWLHLLYFSPVCILKVSSNRLSKKRQSHIGCISFLQCVLSNVSSSWLPEKRQIHIGCIYLAFHQCAFSNVSSNRLPKERHCHIGCTCLTFLHCAFSNVALNCLQEKMYNHIGCIYLTFLHCGFLKCVLKLLACEDA